MREYDSLHSGIITRGQFLSSLSMLKIYFSMKEADLLYIWEIHQSRKRKCYGLKSPMIYILS